MKTILSLDQAMRCGVSVFSDDEQDDDFKLIHYECYIAKGQNYDLKIFDLCDYIEELFKKYDIDFCVLEDIQCQLSSNTFKKLAELQGAIIHTCYKYNVNYKLIHSSTWRSGLKIKGKKREELKEQSKKYVLNKYGIDVTDDISDSICIGTYYLQCEYNIKE